MKNKSLSKLQRALVFIVSFAMLVSLYPGGLGIKSSADAAPATLNESFNNISTLYTSGWMMINNSSPVGTTSWFQGTPVLTGGPFDSYSGLVNAYIGANFNNTAGTGTISNWLLTPELTINNGTVLRFYTRKNSIAVGGTDYPDRLEVRMSKNGSSTNVGTTSSVGDFDTLLLSINPTQVAGGYPYTWTEYVVLISDLVAPVTGRFAFRYYVTNGGPSGARSDYIGIDDVRVEEAVVISELSAPPAFTAGTDPTLTYPTVSSTYTLSSPGWQIKRTTDSSYSEYHPGTNLDASYHNASLRYYVNSILGTVYSYPVTLTVNNPTTLTLTATPTSPTALDGSVTFTATVAGEGTPSGTVTFYDGLAQIGSPVALVNGEAELTTSALALGEHSVSAVFTSTENYASSEDAISYTITKKNQGALSIGNVPGLITYGDGSFTFLALGGSGTGALSWKSDNTDVLLVDPNTGDVTVVGAGEATISVKKAEDGTYFEQTASVSLTVEKAAQQPIFINEDVSIIDISENELQLSLTGGSGSGLVTWESSDDDVLVVNDTGLVTIVGKGTATISVTMLADDNHSNTVSDSITIIVIDKTDLSDVIDVAASLRDNAVIGEGDGQYSEAAVEDLDDAIAAALAVLNNTNATQDEIDEAVSDLNGAMDAFLVQAYVVDGSELDEEIADADELLESVDVGDQEGQYPQGAYEAFQGAIRDAEEVLNNPNSSQEDMDNALSNLRDAVEDFLASVNPPAEEPVDETPGTGDKAMVLYIIMAILTLAAAVITRLRYKKRVQGN